MTTLERIQAFAQSVSLIRSGKFIEDITGIDGADYVNKVIEWTNQLVPELESEADWNSLRDNDYILGTASAGARYIYLPDDVRKLVYAPLRKLVISQDGTPVSYWDVIAPNMIVSNSSVQRCVTVVGRKVIFSRPLTDAEANGEITADVVFYMPTISLTNVDLLDTFEPKQLLVLGVAKNATLPDLVQGETSASFAQKYSDELSKSVAINDASSQAEYTVYDDLSYISGV